MTQTPSLQPLQALAEKARAATPGEWFIHPKDLEAVNNRTTHRGQLVIHGITDGAREEDAAYIVAAQPSVILAIEAALRPFLEAAKGIMADEAWNTSHGLSAFADADEYVDGLTYGHFRALAALDHGSRGT